MFSHQDGRGTDCSVNEPIRRYAARPIEYVEDNKGVVMDDYLKEALEITRAQLAFAL